jgi:hypothetical protein
LILPNLMYHFSVAFLVLTVFSHIYFILGRNSSCFVQEVSKQKCLAFLFIFCSVHNNRGL